MSRSSVDNDLLRDKRLVPRNPFEVQATQSIMQKHLDAGDIQPGDVEILKDSYRLVSTSSVIGSIAMGTWSYFFLRRRTPLWSLGPRMLFAGGMGMVGSFIGFAVGGVAAAVEVNHKMVDAQKKMRVFADIALESKKVIIDSRTGGRSSGDLTMSPQPRKTTPNRETSRWDSDVEGERERREEMDRERQLSSDLRQLEDDGAMARDDGDKPMTSGEIGRATKGAWDKLRTASPNNTSMAGTLGTGMGRDGQRDGTGMMEDERTKAQREFDDLLEQERKGLSSNETWR